MNLSENNSKTQPQCGKFPHNFAVTCPLSYFIHESHPITWRHRQRGTVPTFATLVLGGRWWSAPHCFIHIWSMIITLHPCMFLLVHTCLYLHCQSHPKIH